MMPGFKVFLGRELSELFGTWKAWVVPMVVLAFSLLSPIVAKLQPHVGLPEATTVDAYMHFGSNLIQVVLMVVIISVAGAMPAERRTGTAILMLTKPLSRTSFLFAKMGAKAAFLIASGAVGAIVCWASAQVYFDNVLRVEFAASVALWMVLATMIVALVFLLGVLLNSQAGAAGGGFAIYIALSLLTLWAPAVEFSPAGLMTLGDQLLQQQEVSVVWPVATALAVIVAASFAAATLFRRQEI